jgi:hypothetical protein
VCVLAGIPVRTLGPQDTLFHLSLHAAHHHGLGGALWMLDLLACLRTWPWTIHGVATAPPPIRRSLWWCLEVLAAHGQDPFPGARDALRPRWVIPGERWILAARRRWELPGEIRYALTLACLPHWRSRVAFLRQLLFPRPGVHSEGFGDGGADVPGWGQHWRTALRLGGSALRVAFSGRGHRSASNVVG